MSPGGKVIGLVAAQVNDRMDPSWPPVLVALVFVVLIGGAIIVAVLFRRFRAAARSDRSGSGWRR
jgi:hypothetical protein